MLHDGLVLALALAFWFGIKWSSGLTVPAILEFGALAGCFVVFFVIPNLIPHYLSTYQISISI